MKKVHIGLLVVSLVGCASNQVKRIDTDVDAVKGTSSSGLVIMKDGQALIQQETNADDELRVQQFKNSELENEVNNSYFDLKRCREELADSRLGGSGQVVEIPEIDGIKSPDAIKEQFGLARNSGNLVFLKKQEFLDKVNNERKYEVSLRTMKKTLRPMLEKCERDNGAARIKAGLPAHRYQGQVKITSEGNISEVVRRHENSLDDAFEILKLTSK